MDTRAGATFLGGLGFCLEGWSRRSMTKAFAYLRVSGRGQIEGDGFPRQLAAIKAYAAQHGIKIVKVFREEGVSGATELENRPALMELLEALAANGTKLVLIEKLDAWHGISWYRKPSLAISANVDMSW